MYRAGALKELTDEISRLRVDIAAIQEVRWKGSGNVQGRDYVIFYSGSNEKHAFGTAFIVPLRLKDIVMEFQPINERLCKLRMRGKKYNVTLINVHAPTEEKDEEEKEIFYDQLDRALAAIPSSDMKIVLGDFNAQVGKETVFMPTIGKNSLHSKTNENGVRMINFATSRSLVVMSTIFPHKENHKQTWHSPNGIFTQIDHVLVSSRHFNKINDVRTYRGADVNSDHFLVVAKVVPGVTYTPQRHINQSSRWSRDKLRNEAIRGQYKEKVEENIRSVPAVSGDKDVETQWEELKLSITGAAEQYCQADRRLPSRSWFDVECAEAIKRCNELRRKWLDRDTRQNRKDYCDARAHAKRIVRYKKRKWMADKVKEIEEARNKNETRKFYKEVQQQKRGFRNDYRFIRSDDGRLLVADIDLQKQWKKHFQTLLRSAHSVGEPSPASYAYHGDDDEDVPPDMEDVADIVEKLKSNKAPGPDGIHAEFLKVANDTFVSEMHCLISQIWQVESMPKEWSEATVVPIYKNKGDASDCKNYRGISLLNTSYKIFSISLYNRLLPYVERKLGEYQGGFRPNRSTIDQIFSLRMMCEKMKEHQNTMWLMFIDYKAAYDSVIREELYQAMKEMGISLKLIRLVMATMRSTSCKVKVNGKLTSEIQVNVGLRQGDSLAPLLFNIVLHTIMTRAGLDESGNIFSKGTQLLAYADDVMIAGRSLLNVKDACRKLEREARRCGLEINEEKTKIMVLRRKKPLRPQKCYTVGNHTFECVTSFKYLGAQFNEALEEEEEIQARIVSANKAFFSIAHVMKSRLVSRTTKLRLYKTLIRPVVTYACETWTLKKTLADKIDVFERRILRRILGPVRENQVHRQRKNRELYLLYGDMQLSHFIRIQRLKWLGHIHRMDDSRTVKRLYIGHPEGVRARGRPRGRWKDSVSEDLRTLKISLRRAADRMDWAKAIEKAKDRLVRLSCL